MHILVTGGAGFVGANLVRLLLAEGCSVRVLDNFSTGQRAYLTNVDVEIIEGSILDVEAVNQAVYNVDGVVHLAAQTGVPSSLKDPYKDCQLNIIGTLNMLEACRHQGVKRFVFASSNAPIGRQPPPATEDKAPLPISPYGASKLAGEGYCLAYHGSWDIETVVLRFANIYGPYSTHKNSVVAKFCKDILANGEITIHGNGQQTRDFIFVKDLCQIVYLALKSKTSGELFQIASGIETSITTLANLVQSTAKQDFSISYAPIRQGDIDRNYSAITKAHEVFGWSPETLLVDGLKTTWEWFQATLYGNNTTMINS